MALEGKRYQAIKVEKEGGITWLYFNRPEKRNAMSPTLHYEMRDAVSELEVDPETKVLVLTGAGGSWCAGQDIREFFRDLDNKPAERRRAGWASYEWQWLRLFTFPAPTIAMVNGYCFGGAFTPLFACDIAIAAEDAIFGLSEVNWGIFPGGIVSRVLADAMTYRDAMYYTLTGEPFDGRKAAEMRLVTKAVPRDKLREETAKLARSLMEKNPNVLRAAKEALKTCWRMDYSQAREYLAAKGLALQFTDPEHGRSKGMAQFLDEKRYRPGFTPYHKEG